MSSETHRSPSVELFKARTAGGKEQIGKDSSFGANVDEPAAPPDKTVKIGPGPPLPTAAAENNPRKRKRSTSPAPGSPPWSQPGLEAEETADFLKGKDSWRKHLLQGMGESAPEPSKGSSTHRPQDRVKESLGGPLTLNYDEDQGTPTKDWDLLHKGVWRQWPCYVEMTRFDGLSETEHHSCDMYRRGDASYSLRAIFVSGEHESHPEAMFRGPSISSQLQVMPGQDEMISDVRGRDGQPRYVQHVITFPMSGSFVSASGVSQVVKNFKYRTLSNMSRKKIPSQLHSIARGFGDPKFETMMCFEWDCDEAIRTKGKYRGREHESHYRHTTGPVRHAINIFRKITGHGGHVRLFIYSPSADLLAMWKREELPCLRTALSQRGESSSSIRQANIQHRLPESTSQPPTEDDGWPRAQYRMAASSTSATLEQESLFAQFSGATGAASEFDAQQPARMNDFQRLVATALAPPSEDGGRCIEAATAVASASSHENEVNVHDSAGTIREQDDHDRLELADTRTSVEHGEDLGSEPEEYTRAADEERKAGEVEE